MKKKIYIIDDEADIQQILKVNLSSSGFDAKTFSSGESALESLKKEKPDLIIIDIMMPGMDGYDFCKRVRASDDKSIPIIFLSAKAEEFDKILGLELGGDDYITKPFSIKEVISRVKAVLRRTDKNENSEENILKYKGIELNHDIYSLKADGKEIKVTKTEFEILHLFLKHPNKIFTRDNIIDSIKGDDIYVIDRTVDVHIMNVRKKLGKYKDIISTFSGVGYGIKE